MEKLRADLHIHTYYSDGVLSPEEVAAEAKKNGVRLISVTDHDCSIAHKKLSALCEKEGIKAVKGIEVSAYIGDVKIHTLGYNLDTENPVFEEFYKKLYEGSIKRAEDIVFKLNANGIKIKMEDILAYRKSELSPVHSMHVSRACALKGYCGGNADTIFFNYLAWGKPAFSGICRPSPEETAEVIKACGGFSSLAHPGRIDMPAPDIVKLIRRLKDCGLGGIEAVYSAHTADETAYYKETANAFGLSVTGGSDTHFIGGWRKIGSPEFYPDNALAEKLGI